MILSFGNNYIILNGKFVVLSNYWIDLAVIWFSLTTASVLWLILTVFWPVQFFFDRFGGFTASFVVFSAGSCFLAYK